MIPPWFQRALSECESLALDVASDRARLWERVRRNMPEHAIEAAIASCPPTLDLSERAVAEVAADVLAALDNA